MSLRRIVCLCVAAGMAVSLAFGGTAHADQTLRVAAVVNHDIISVHDFDSAVKLSLLFQGLQDTMDNRNRIAPLVIRSLIDQELQIQEAKRLEMTVSPADIGRSVEGIATANRMSVEQFEALLKKNDVDIETYRQQVRAQMLWDRILRRARVRDVHVGEEAVDARLDSLRANLGKPEYQVSEIFLPVDTPSAEPNVRNLAERLIGQLQPDQGKGAPFALLAAQFSQTGAGGGNLGWVSEGLLDESLLAALAKIDVGKVTQPVRTADGYHILMLQAKRRVGEGISSGPSVDLMSIDLISLPSAGQAERDSQMAHLQEAVAPAKSCDDLIELIKKVPSASINLPYNTPTLGLPKEVFDMTGTLTPGAISAPLDVDRNTRRVFAICARYPDPGGLPSRKDIRRQLEDEQLVTIGQRIMRDLHRSAFIELRL